MCSAFDSSAVSWNPLRIPSIRSVIYTLCLIAMVGLCMPESFAQTSNADSKGSIPHLPTREIRVPISDLPILLSGVNQRMFLTRSEYEDLIKKAKLTPEQMAVAQREQLEKNTIPVNAVVLDARYSILIETGRALITGEITIDVLKPGIQAIPLVFQNVGLMEASIDGAPAYLSHPSSTPPIPSPSDTTKSVTTLGLQSPFLFVDGQGIHKLKLKMVAAVRASAAQQTLNLVLPRATTNSFVMKVPGNVEIVSGASVRTRQVDATANTTEFSFLPNRNETSNGIIPVNMVMTLNNKMLRDTRSLECRSFILDEISGSYEQIQLRVVIDVLNGAENRFLIEVPEGFEVRQVISPLLSRWNMTEKSRNLEIELREPVSDQVVIDINAIKAAAVSYSESPTMWNWPVWRVLDTDSQSAILGINLERGLELRSLEYETLIPLDNSVLSTVIPANLTTRDPTAPVVRTAISLYSPSGTQPVSAQIAKPKSLVKSNMNMMAIVSESGIRLKGFIDAHAAHESISRLDLEVDPSWRMQSANLLDGTKLSFDLVDTNRTTIRLSSPMAPNTSTRILFELSSIPSGWLSQWSERSFSFPKIAIRNFEEENTILSAMSDGQLTLSAMTSDGLTALFDRERQLLSVQGDGSGPAFSALTSNWQLVINATRNIPQIASEVFSFFKVATETLKASYELHFDIKQAATDELQFSLAESTPSEITIRGLDNTVVKESNSRIVDGRRVWTIKLANRESKLAKLLVEFSFDRIPNQEQLLPNIRVHNTIYQTGLMAIEGTDELDIEILKNPRRADVGELTESSYVLGSRLLGVFGYNIVDNKSFENGEDSLSIRSSQRKLLAVPSTIIQRLSLVSALSADRASYHLAELQLSTVGGYIQAKLPDGATLWTITVDGQPSLPQRKEGQLVIELRSTAAAFNNQVDMSSSKSPGVHNVRLAYEVPIRTIGIRTNITLMAPSFATVQSEAGPSEAIPVADTQWQVWMSGDLHLVGADGDLTLVENVASTVFPFTLGKYLGGLTPISDSREASDSYTIVQGIPNEIDRSRSLSSKRVPKLDQPLPARSSISRPGMPPPGARAGQAAGPATQSPMAGEMTSPFYLDDNVEYIPQPVPSQLERAQQPSQLPAEQSFAAQTPSSKNRSMSNALDGLKTLPIAFENPPTWQSSQLHGFGNDVNIQLSVVNNQRLKWLGWACAIAIIAIGLLAIKLRFGIVLFWGIIAQLISIAAPLLTAWTYEVGVVAGYCFFAILAILILRMILEVTRWAVARGRKVTNPFIAAILMLVWVTILGATATCSAQDRVPKPIGSFEEFMAAVHSNALRSETPIEIPADAILVPYDPKSQLPKQGAEKILIPYSVYKQLWNLAHPDQADPLPVESPAEYSLSNLRYTTTLDKDEILAIAMEVEIAIYTDRSILIPFGFSDAVLTQAKWNAEPASIRSALNSLMLAAQGKGNHKFAASFQIPIVRQGGWRTTNAMLPSAQAGKLTLIVPNANTEIRLAGLTDGQQRETTTEKETIETVFPHDGHLSLQWRPKVSESSSDQGLSVNTVNTLSIEEQGIRTTWDIKLDFRRGRREAFEFELPKDLLVEKVVGKNVRGWTTKTVDDKQMVQVTLLKPAVESEELSIVASRPQRLGLERDQSVIAPRISVPEAMLHQGRITIYRSDLIDAQIQDSSGLVREDLPRATTALSTNSPVAMKAFQAYRYAMAEYNLMLRVNAVPMKLQSQSQTTLRASRNDSQLESTLTLTSVGRPLHRVKIRVTDLWKWNVPRSAVPFEWTLSEAVDGVRIYDIQFALGHSTPVTLTLSAIQRRTLDDSSNDYTAPIPHIQVVDALKEQGDVQVFADAGFDVLPEQLENCQSVGLGIGPIAPNAQSAAGSNLRAVVRYTSGTYKGMLRFRARTPQITVMSISNVKLTRRSLEETVYIEWNIREAGLHTIEFTLPERLKDATVLAQMIRSIKRDASEDPSDGSVRFTLELQEDVMGQYRVLVQQDSPLPSGVHSVPIPSKLTGSIESRLVTLENSGGDELVTDSLVGIAPMVRGEAQWVKLSSLLGGKAAEAFRVEESNQASTSMPKLTFKSRSRSIVATVSARIALAKTTMSVDASGSYRASQEFRVENTSEPFLEVELPAGAKLWTVSVAKIPVKPIESPNKAKRPGGARLRLPLVRTQTGDLDYGVELKYAGNLTRPSLTTKLEFPLIEAININVELTQVKLMLPENQYWYGFEGTLGRVDDESEFLAGWLSQKNKQLERLSELAANDSEAFAQARAESNLKELQSEVKNQLESNNARQTLNPNLQKQLASNEREVEKMLKQDSETLSQKAKNFEVDNRTSFNSLFDEQTNYRAKGNLDLQVRSNIDGLESMAKSPFKPNDYAEKFQGRAQAVPADAFKKARSIDGTMVEGKQGEDRQAGSRREDNPSDSKDNRALAQSYKGKIQNLSRQQSAAAGPANNAWMDASGITSPNFGGGGYGGEGFARDMPGAAGMPMGGMGMEGGMPGGAGMGGMGMGGAATESTVSLGSSVNSPTPSMNGRQSGEYVAGFASLDVAFETRGRPYYFTTPRGEATLSVSGISQSIVQRAIVLTVLIIILLIMMIISRRWSSVVSSTQAV